MILPWAQCAVIAFALFCFPPADPCDAEPPPSPPPDGQSVMCATPEEAARTWIDAAFPPEHRAAAVHIVRYESQFRTDICYGFRKKGDPYCEKDKAAVGLWQHRRRFWDDRSGRAAEWYGITDGELDIWDGWHSTLVARWLLETDGRGRTNWTGWGHFDACRESDRREVQAFGRAYVFPAAIWCGK